MRSTHRTLMTTLIAAVMALSGPAAAELEISGWINEAAIYFDDGEQEDFTQVADNGTTLGSRITFAGSTDLKFGLEGGFEVIVEPLSPDSPLIFANQDGNFLDTASGGVLEGGAAFEDTNNRDINVLGSSAYVKGPFGKVTVGLQTMPTDNIAVLADPSATLWSAISPVFRANGFDIRGASSAGIGSGAVGLSAGGPVWGDFLGCLTTPGLAGPGGIGIDCNGIYRSGIRWDLPVEALTGIDNLSIAGSWANDNVFDIAGKYNTEVEGVKVMLHAGWSINTDPGTGLYDESHNVQVQLGLMHAQTGLFGTVAYQHESADLLAAGETANFEDDTDAVWLKVGVKRQLVAIGDTSLDFQYGSYNDQFGFFNAFTNPNGLDTAPIVTDSEVERIGVALNQYFGDKLILYAAWENLDLSTDGNAAAEAALGDADDINLVTLGMTFFF